VVEEWQPTHNKVQQVDLVKVACYNDSQFCCDMSGCLEKGVLLGGE
jgi:hypothetical protein